MATTSRRFVVTQFPRLNKKAIPAKLKGLAGPGNAVAVKLGPEAAVKAALPCAFANFPVPPVMVNVPLKGPKV